MISSIFYIVLNIIVCAFVAYIGLNSYKIVRFFRKIVQASYNNKKVFFEAIDNIAESKTIPSNMKKDIFELAGILSNPKLSKSISKKMLKTSKAEASSDCFFSVEHINKLNAEDGKVVKTAIILASVIMVSNSMNLIQKAFYLSPFRAILTPIDVAQSICHAMIESLHKKGKKNLSGSEQESYC